MKTTPNTTRSSTSICRVGRPGRAAGACPSRRGFGDWERKGRATALDARARTRARHQTGAASGVRVARRLTRLDAVDAAARDYHAATTRAAASRGPSNRSTAARTRGRASYDGSVPRSASKNSGSSLDVDNTHASESTA